MIVNPVSFGGQLLAHCTAGPHVADYVADLVTRNGKSEVRERPVRADEVGRAAREVAEGRVVRVYRGDRAIGVAEPDAQRLAAGDLVIELLDRPR